MPKMILTFEFIKDPDRLEPLQQKETKIKSQLDPQIAANNATLESLGKVNITYGLLTLS